METSFAEKAVECGNDLDNRDDPFKHAVCSLLPRLLSHQDTGTIRNQETAKEGAYQGDIALGRTNVEAEES